MRKIFKETVSIEKAKEILFQFYKPRIEIEEVDLLQSLGRILAEDVRASVSLPPFDRVVMDGYALKAEDTFGADENNPAILKVVGRIEAGEWCEAEIYSGEAIEVATGSVLPKGANAVVMVEFTREKEGFIEIFKSVAPGENVLFAGSDVMAGEIVLRRGKRLTHREIAILSACGISKVKVYRKPVVAVISTGNELIEPGEKLEKANIYDVNSYMLSSAIIECGGSPVRIGIVRDEEEEIERAITHALDVADLVLTSGSTSAGFGDSMFNVLSRFDPGLLVHGIAVKPGKPTIIAVHREKPIFALPGYPTSALTIFELLVAPVLRKLSGLMRESKSLKARLAVRITSEPGRREFLPVNVIATSEGYKAYPVLGSYSGTISAIYATDGFIEIPEDVLMLEENEEVEVKLFGEIKPANLVIIGSHCIAIDLLLELMGELEPKIINLGSTAGILAVKRREADVAGIHLLSEDGNYNETLVRRFGVEDAVLVKGYLREQGFIVARGNPKGIKSIEDLLREEVRIVNRNRGSGTRVLLDMQLQELARKTGIDFEEIKRRIRGYEVEAKTHDAVAISIATGKADVGLGIKSVAKIYGLDFIPLRAEEFDFLIPKDRLRKNSVERFLECLQSEEFAERLKKFEGLRVYERTGEKIEI
ncbi:MAG: molybdopterin biosynthesis protein [Archaeoglobaceae archaeon]|nr:molybdopterin biosynthesis protein [Archaeoglobaceae archaeon]MDW8118295.1 molybdopterin biosynthesis protein [Archaeoglobaceae archaeon]